MRDIFQNWTLEPFEKFVYVSTWQIMHVFVYLEDTIIQFQYFCVSILYTCISCIKKKNISSIFAHASQWLIYLLTISAISSDYLLFFTQCTIFSMIWWEKCKHMILHASGEKRFQVDYHSSIVNPFIFFFVVSHIYTINSIKSHINSDISAAII